jgi:hypothetical protein
MGPLFITKEGRAAIAVIDSDFLAAQVLAGYTVRNFFLRPDLRSEGWEFGKWHSGRLTDRQSAAQGGPIELKVYEADHKSTGGIWLDMRVKTPPNNPMDRSGGSTAF